MHKTVYGIRLVFALLSVAIATSYTTTTWPGEVSASSIALGILLGLIVATASLLVEKFFKKLDLRALNLSILGLVLGYILATLLITVTSAIFDFNRLDSVDNRLVLIKAVVYLFSCYFAMIAAVKASEEFHVSIPFFRFQASTERKRDIILDVSVLTDARLIDLAATGLLDHHIIVPRFLLKECYEHIESHDEAEKVKARRSLEVLKKLEALPSLGIRYVETDFSDVTDLSAKVIRLARLSGAHVLTSDMNRVQQAAIESTEGIRIVNLNLLSNALKPLTTTGEMLDIKIQRYGKEPGQGIGYLEDGTMVVVNGGADFIGRLIKTHVLSVKHTSSGRMIFCNANEEEMDDGGVSRPTARSYFALER